MACDDVCHRSRRFRAHSAKFDQSGQKEMRHQVSLTFTAPQPPGELTYEMPVHANGNLVAPQPRPQSEASYAPPVPPPRPSRESTVQFNDAAEAEYIDLNMHERAKLRGAAQEAQYVPMGPPTPQRSPLHTMHDAEGHTFAHS